MKKKLILSVICTILLSFGAMAKSHSSTKIKHGDVKPINKKMKHKTCTCFLVTTSCGAGGIACGSTIGEIIEGALQAERAFC